MPDLVLNYNDVRFDQQGRPYWTTQSGQPSYIPPIAAAQSPNIRARQWAASQGVTPENPSGNVPQGGFAKSRGEWNPQTGQYDQGMNMSGLGGAILGGAAVAGPAVIGPALFGPGAAAAPVGGLSADGTIPFTTAPGVHAAALSGSVGPASGLGAAGGSAAGGAAASGGLAGFLKNLTGGQNLTSFIGLGTSLAGGLGGGGSSDDELKNLQAITEARMRRVDPLHQAITNLAMSRLPTNMQRPVPDIPLPGSNGGR